MDAGVVKNMRDRTRKLYEKVAFDHLVPTSVLDLLRCFSDRLDDLEEAAGYDAATLPSTLSKVDTQGR